MVLSPTAIANSTWSYDTVIGNTCVMILAIIVIFDYIFKNRTLTDGASKYVLRLMGAYGLMMAGLFVWLLYGDVLALRALHRRRDVDLLHASSSTRRRLINPPLVGWQIEAALGLRAARRDLRLRVLHGRRPGHSGARDKLLHESPLRRADRVPSLTVVGAAFYDFVVGRRRASPASFWFLVMMGVRDGCPGGLQDQVCQGDWRPRIRLLLVLVAYALYTLFFPTFVFSASAADDPVDRVEHGARNRGRARPRRHLWSSSRPICISGGISFFFGSRNVCSIFCTAAPDVPGDDLRLR